MRRTGLVFVLQNGRAEDDVAGPQVRCQSTSEAYRNKARDKVRFQHGAYGRQDFVPAYAGLDRQYLRPVPAAAPGAVVRAGNLMQTIQTAPDTICFLFHGGCDYQHSLFNE